jgi:hypothetical protein
MKIAIVTSVFGSQTLHSPTQWQPEADYYAFVDRKRDCLGWTQIIHSGFSSGSHAGRRNAKVYKVLPNLVLPDYDYWIWVDPTHDVITSPVNICNQLGDKDFGLFRHVHRDCVYTEISECRKLGLDLDDNFNRYEDFLHEVEYPKSNGLYELPAFVKKNSERSLMASLKWWEIICRFSSRDQVSLPYVLWSNNMSPHIFDGWANNGLGQNKYMPQVRWKNV